MAIKIKSILKIGSAILLLFVVILAIAGYWLLNTQSGLRLILKQASPMVEISSASGNALNAQLNGLKVDTDLVNITAESAKLDWSLKSLLNQSLTINSLTLSQLNVTLKDQTDKTPSEYQPWQGIDLPIDIDLRQSRVSNFRLILNDTELLALSRVDLQANIKTNLLTINQLDIEQAENTLSILGRVDLSADQNGKVDLQHSASWAIPSFQIITQGTINGEWQELRIQQTLSSPFAIELDATLNDGLSELLSWNAQLSSSQLPDQQLMGEVVSIDDGTFESRGQFAPGEGLNSLQADIIGTITGGSERFARWQIDTSTGYQQGNLQIDNLRLTQLNTQTPRTVEVNGVINNLLAFVNTDNGVGDVDVTGQWHQLQWPLITDSPDVLADGQFKVTGSSNDYQLIARTNGQIQGRTLQASADVGLTGELITINSLALFAGNTKAIVNGTINSAYNINWQLNSPNIGDLVSDASGNLTSQGRLTGARDKPVVKLNASSQGLNAYGYSVEALQLDADASLGNWQDKLNVVLNTGKIRNATTTIAESVDLELTGTGLQHSLSIDAILGMDEASDNSEISIQADGGIDNQRWVGQLSELTLVNPLLKTWSLEKSVDLDVAMGALNVSETCLLNNDQALCFAATQNSQNFVVKGTVQSLNFANLDQFTKIYELTTEGTVSGEFSYAKAASDDTSVITAKFDSTSSSISWPEPGSESGERETLLLDAFKVELQQDNVLDLKAYLKLKDGDSLDAQINIADGFESPQFQAAKLSGRVNIVFQQLANLPPSVLNDIALNGGFTSNITLGGSLNEPSLQLLAEARNASASIELLGLQLEQINITASSSDGSMIILDGSLISGEGLLDIDGSIDLSTLTAPVIAIALNGQNLQLANSPELSIIGDVTFNTKINNQLIDLQGAIVINEAELDFKLPENAVLASNDVVLAGQEEVVKGASQQLDLSIDLGQKTHIQAKGLDANLTGKLRISQTPNSIIRGEGEINVVNGKYAAYGEELDIERGRLIFNRGSIDDPNLELRAQKTVDSITAGVSVVGRASSPQLNLYSTPSMSDQDVLSVLIFGKALSGVGSEDGLTLLRIANSLRGDGEESQITKTTNNIRDSLGLTDLALQVDGNAPTIEAGKQLSSKLYIGYGYGLLDAAQSLILRYQLSNAWSIKADVGADSGADLRYQVER